ncbi:MAG: hypothetical protein BGO43_13355 [Gammaproteobacteria bacterium 39-13]|nr:hypothetical protein [Gammaproteobacteria bacterium]OJV85714.1 MAG: hypothetical protein BGO43_13355 [Gammaproteobacteria bacterium 39-13]
MKNCSLPYLKWILAAALFPMASQAESPTATKTETAAPTAVTTQQDATPTSTTAPTTGVLSADPTTATTTPAAATAPELPKVKGKLAPKTSLLPDDIKVYYNEKVGLSRNSFKSGKENVLPTNNDYNEVPGCYIACYSSDAKIAPQYGAYPVGDNTYIMGQVRVKGNLHDGYCIPAGFEGKDIRVSKEMKETCEKSFPAMCEKSTCWANSKISTLIY